MWTMLRKLILGIPEDHQTATVGNAVVEPQPEALPKYLPASQLTEAQIEGVGETGDVWVPWRVDPDGEQWYQRLSRDAPQPSLIVGLLDDSRDINADDDDSGAANYDA